MISQPAVPSVQVRYGLLEVHVALQLQDAPGGAAGVARSGLLVDGRRGISVWALPSSLTGQPRFAPYRQPDRAFSGRARLDMG
jgi:hypothetical protein